MTTAHQSKQFSTVRERLIGLSLESSRKSYYPQLQAQMVELKKAEERYRLLFENASDAIFIVQDEKIKFPNPTTLRMLGLSARELAQRSFTEFVHPDDRELVLNTYKRKIAGIGQLPATYIFRIITPADQKLVVQISTVMITWENKPATLCFIRDITEQKKLEANLRQSQKLEAVGTLAGGIAHDFNNILMGIQGRISMMLADLDATHPHYVHAKEIEQYVTNATELTSQLLGFAKGGRYQIKPTNMNELLTQSSEMFGRTRKEIRIIRELDDNLWTVEVDRGQLNQVLLNLYVNAWQAMPQGGDLYLHTCNIAVDIDFMPAIGLHPGQYIKISVTDTGIGMDKATRVRIFDPFFTTKAMGCGTGLGLASVYGIIKNHEGDIRVYSEPGQGATFTIYLPACEKAVQPERVTASEICMGQGVILLVDDEEMIVEVGQQMLERLGYNVLVASSGRNALEIMKDKHSQIDLVILDMIMPDISGAETFSQIRRIDPHIKVLLSSGYSINGHAVKILDRGCDGFIQKPFSLNALSRIVQNILTGEKHKNG